MIIGVDAICQIGLRWFFLCVLAGVLSAASGGVSADMADAQSALRPGMLLTHTPLTTAAALPSAGRNTLITYMSQGPTGKLIVVSGTVAVPRTPPPPGGYPVVSWAHGSSGYADICAPSEDTADGPYHSYYKVVDPVLDAWVAKGYVVVQTDYQGLGTPGGHPYMNGISEANTVTDIVRAARQLDHSIGTDWVAMGHSQGGHAALFTAQYGQAHAPQLHLKGVVAIAPGGKDLADTVAYIRSAGPSSELAEPFLPLLLLGAQVVDPAIDPYSMFTPAAQRFLAVARTGCVAQLRGIKPVPPKQVFRADADTRPLMDYLGRQDPDNVKPNVPTMIVQGVDDRPVPKAGTDALVKKMCRDFPIDYRVYPGETHRGSLTASLSDVFDFVGRVMAGRRVPNSCAN